MRQINANGFPQWHITLHEYGHYMSWSYGSMGNTCNYRVNESDSIEEAFADVFFMAYMKHQEGTSYTAPNTPFLPRTSLNGTTELPHNNVGYSDRCGEIYQHTAPFLQAMWEVLDGTNRSTKPYTNLLYVNVANPAVDAALFYMAVAMNALEPDITYEQLITRMSIVIPNLQNRNSFLNVFRHHGFNV